MKVAIQGIPGSFHHEAAIKLLGPEIDILHCKTFREVFESVQKGQADRGVAAVENSLHGSINAVYRLLARGSAWVGGEVFLHIEQFLVGTPGANLKGITKVISQAPALAQCELWFEANLPEAVLEETSDTAESVRTVVSQDNPSLAAVAGKKAAELYGGKVLTNPINDDKHNYTRFFLLCANKQLDEGADKTSIILETGHQPGALYRALGAFAEAGINLSKLDSHPIPGNTRRYAFYIDFEAGLDDNLDHNILGTLRAQGCKVTVLGSYRHGEEA